MRVVLLNETYSKNMGYAENCLPKAMARIGAEVHLLATDLPPYYHLPDVQDTYGSFFGTRSRFPEYEDIDGYRVHYLPHERRLGYARMKGLFSKLKSLRPDIVQTFVAISWIPLESALAKPLLGYRLFTGSHTAASTFPLYRRKVPPWDPERIASILMRALPGRFISLFTDKCYAVTIDCADIAVRFFGVQKSKVEIMHLGVDTDFFFPVSDEATASERERVRAELGADRDDIVCIYTGKLNESKNALILAWAVARLRSAGLPFLGLFVGHGVQSEAICATPSCVVKPFMPYQQLGAFYRAADIGVWPTNESTSMLDAAACGLPLIVSNGIVYRDHVEGNGLVHRMNDLDDLVRVLLELKDAGVRKKLGTAGAVKMLREFNWNIIARRRLADYEATLNRSRTTDAAA